VAIDLGAESCRVSLLRWVQGLPEIAVVHRFPNSAIHEKGSLRWDIAGIYWEIERGLTLCADIADEGIASIGVDGWAVDYVRIGAENAAIENPYCYRDERTVDAQELFHYRISRRGLYDLTGIQLLRFNTVYQLYADRLAGMDPKCPWLNLPEFITVRLGARRFAEYTNATHTGLVKLGTREWCKEVFDAGHLSLEAAPEIVAPGTRTGVVGGALADLWAFRDTQLIAPACHDTAAAIAGLPAEGDDWAFISSGTWSLVGTLLDEPCVSDESFQKNFTNLGGAGGKICFLKNVNGMWLLRHCIEHWESQGHTIDLAELIHECESLAAPDHLLDVDDPALLLPGDMLGKINAQFERFGHPSFAGDRTAISQLSNMIFHSLAARYAQVLEDMQSVTGKKVRRLYVVGGGSRNAFLNRLTSMYTALEVLLGSSESATVGNFAIQLASLNDGIRVDGVDRSSVAAWAAQLSRHPMRSAAKNGITMSADILHGAPAGRKIR
jgi:rhamnulokinase